MPQMRHQSEQILAETPVPWAAKGVNGDGDFAQAGQRSATARRSAMTLGQPLLDSLERMGNGGVLLDGSGNALALNSSAERLLSAHRPECAISLDWVRGAIRRLLTAGNTRFVMQADNWIVVPQDEGRPLVLHSVPVEGESETDPHMVLILVGLDVSPAPNPAALQRMFGLTEAEAKLAIQIARGNTPAEIATANGVTMATVRSQLSSVLAKTQTERQAELVALLARVSILP